MICKLNTKSDAKIDAKNTKLIQKRNSNDAKGDAKIDAKRKQKI
jgi:hypothetical protein